MCLTTNPIAEYKKDKLIELNVKTAKEDMLVYKVFIVENDGTLITPFK